MPNPPSETEIADLVTGQLSPFAAWKLRRKIAKSPELRHELAETESLFADLQTLRAERPARFAPDFTTVTDRRDAPPTVWKIGGFAMNKRAAFAATAALSLLCVSGGYAAVQYFFFAPLGNLDAGHGTTWNAELDFRGEAKFRDATGTNRGSISFSGDSTLVKFDSQGSPQGTPTLNVRRNPVSAKITVGAETFPVTGAGFHKLYAKNGAFLGTVELVPQTKSKYEAEDARHDKENGIEQQLHISYGARDGFGKCYGYFGDGAKRIMWSVWGENITVKFFDDATGKQVYQAKSFPVNDAIRAAQKRDVSPAIYAATVAEALPPAPIFTWRVGNAPAQTRKGVEPIRFTLSDGIRLRAELVATP